MNENGGIKDDCIVTKLNEDHFYMVVNAGCKYKDMGHMKIHLQDKKFAKCSMEYVSGQFQSLVAIQGPNS